MTKKIRNILCGAAALVVGFAVGACGGSMISSAIAGDAVATTQSVDLTPIYQAFLGHNFALGLALLVILGTTAAKRYLSGSIPFLNTNAGGSLLALIMASATAAAAAFGAPGATFTLSLFENALMVGISAAGGYAVIKNLIIDPLLPKLPPWAQLLLTPLLWVFTKAQATNTAAVATATAAGDAAVTAKPPAGVAGVTGAATEVK